MHKKSVFIILTIIINLAILGVSEICLAQLTINAPSQAIRGNAFVAEAISSLPEKEIAFIWRGKRHLIAASPLADGGSVAKILLPVPLNEPAAQLQLQALAAKGGQARLAINIKSISRPVQKLNVDRKYVTPPREVLSRIQTDREKVKKALNSSVNGSWWQVPLHRPVQGGVSSQFGLKRVFNGQPRGEHKGLDLRGAQGTPIGACADGVVVLADNLYYSGNTVYVNHGDGVISAYLHMSETDVKPGDKVTKGQTLGKVGATGRVTGPHLHLSLYAQGVAVDPLPLLEQPQSGDNGNRLQKGK